ncbi:putative glycogen debranching enzyme protein [Neofusicoccum parvum UCRNP2]|uniref:Glycogen debranching enzyme n=1 Tax=Botryosphaeria parva (strain UCR-NP2) TaxID=1287680 RepID=R1ENZ2_BOTPV|nr:putative glycogen debranching enzyme protein [Neofusicoccum parvum UCRNP2]
MSNTVYLLPLTDGGAPDVPGTYIYLPPPTSPAYTIRFAIEGTSSICREGSLWVNIPAEGEQFQRDRFREFKLRPDFNGTIEIDCPVHVAGAFAFYSTYTPLPDFAPHAVTAPKPTKTPTYYIDICPRLMMNDRLIQLDSLSIFSVISKFMGKYPDDWDKHLRGISQRGYNMIHFTPLMMRGSSNSPYSIYDQHQFDKNFFPNGEKDIAELIGKMEKEFNLFGLTDVVWNHTANNSKWLEEHPEAGYNCETAPHLQSALELDDALLKLGRDLHSLGLPTTIKSMDDLNKIMEAVKSQVIAGIKLWEFYVVDVERDTKEIVKAWTEGEITFPDGGFGNLGVGGLQEIKDWSLKQKADWLINHALSSRDTLGGRFQRKIDARTGAALLAALFGRHDSRNHSTPDERAAQGTIHKFLDEVNLEFYKEYDADVATIVDQLSNRIKYVRLDDHGPKLGPITNRSPLIETYFTRLPKNETTKKHSPRALALVNNGWIWAADAMKDNAGPQSRAYLRREVIVWGDCVKLRYGSGPQDNPFLWDFIAKYTRLMAKYFVGFRIDNCHSTPIHVAEHMLDEARKVRPDLVVGAELFTGSEDMDFVFCKRLGISFLIREAMQAWSTQELSRLVHRHAGIPIGSFELDEVSNADPSAQTNSATKKEIVRKIRQSPVHALFMDCTHDNEVPAQKRDARDTLPNAALVAMCACATGSVMGYDEIYPQLIELVHETRLYSSPYSTSGELKVQAAEGGIGNIKKLLNQIHTLMGQEGYDETFIHHDREFITVHRVHPKTRKGYFLIAHTAFPGYGDGNGGFPPVQLPGTQAKLIGSWFLEVEDSQEVKARTTGDKKALRGLPSRTKDLQGVKIESSDAETKITIPDFFPPGSIALFETSVPSCEHSDGLDVYVTSGAKDAFKECSLIDLNHVLYRCDPEERDYSGGNDGTYTIPGHGTLVYAGFQGWWSVLRDVVRHNKLGHPICDHLRQGQWALDYCVGRLERLSKLPGYEKLQGPVTWLQERFDAIRKIPSFMLPRYFALTIQTAYNAAVDRSIELLSDNVRNGQKFLQELSLVSIQVTGHMNNASLWPTKSVPSMAAGLPHFASDWARCWGRDIFISLRGLYLGTGRYDDAREHIIAFGSVVKHGMIPNLLSSGKLPRYNSRDSVWFYLQNIQDYTKIVPDGVSILQESVKRRFLPYDDTWFPHDDPKAYSQSSSIEDIIQECLQRHASGMSFREYNAGPDLDMQMKPEGFQIDIHPDWKTGIIFGGNQFNCGTWMDKMGESEKAGNKGVPGTPRDGAAIEITGLLYSTLKWVSGLHKDGKYKYDGVDIEGGQHLSFADWAAKIKDHFEWAYYVPREPAQDKDYDVNSSIVNRRGIYKDLYKSGKEYEDYQLRPNFTIAMTVAPDLFEADKALYALHVADTALRGPTGMATLDPSDLNYRPNYINSEDSTDFHTAKGRNYHQGPEWLWPTGFFLRAFLKFDLLRRKTPEERVETFQQITRRLRGCMDAIKETPWAGLTELTNKDGSFCGDSSPTQSWSASCLIDLYQDAKEYGEEFAKSK